MVVHVEMKFTLNLLLWHCVFQLFHEPYNYY